MIKKSENCLFCKIVDGSIPSSKVFENENVLAFNDLYPQAKTHILFIHKNHTTNINEMSENAKSIADVFEAIKTYTDSTSLSSEGFRVVTNSGKHGGQTVFHTHFHLLGGESLRGFGS